MKTYTITTIYLNEPITGLSKAKVINFLLSFVRNDISVGHLNAAIDRLMADGHAEIDGMTITEENI